MGLPEVVPDFDPLLRFALQLDVINHLLCSNFKWSVTDIELW